MSDTIEEEKAVPPNSNSNFDRLEQITPYSRVDTPLLGKRYSLAFKEDLPLEDAV